MTIEFQLTSMNGAQLAMLYKFLLSMYRIDEADEVYKAGVSNCGAKDFCWEVAILK